jgi:hypothetical protein
MSPPHAWHAKRKLLPHAGHELGPGDPRGVVRAGPHLSVAADSGVVTVAPEPTGRGLALFADVSDSERRDGSPQLVVRRKHPVVAVPMLPRRRDEIRQTIEKLKRRELDNAVGFRPRGLPPTTPPDPVGRRVPR